MSVAEKLASALGRNDERPNVALARELAAAPDDAAIAELAGLLTAGDRPVRHDAIKVLYELGERRPELIAPHLDVFVSLLQTRDNRMLWGALSALAALGTTKPHELAARLDAILAAADRGSVIARDKAMKLLSDLNARPDLERRAFKWNRFAALSLCGRIVLCAKPVSTFAHDALNPRITPILLQRLSEAAVNQVPMYAEFAAPTIAETDKPAFRRIVETWRDKIPMPAKKKRLEKVLKQIDR